MSLNYSFDIVSKVDAQEIKNAVDQSQKELAGRFDFKGSNSEISLDKDIITLLSDDEFKLKQLQDILEKRLIKRNIDIRMVEYGKHEPATGLSIRQKVTFKQGIAQEKAKELTKLIREKKFNVQGQIQGDEVRISSKNKDDLQKVIQFLKSIDLGYPIDFTNYR